MPFLMSGSYTPPELPSNDYIDHLKSTGKLSAAVLYGSLLFKFQKWLHENGYVEMDNTPPALVEQYLATLKSPSSVNGSLAAIRGYFKFKSQSLPVGDPRVVVEMQRLNQVSSIRPKRKPRSMKKISLTPGELKNFLKMLRDHQVSEELYSGIVTLFYFGGRAKEFAEFLAKADVDFKKREMKIQTCKTYAERYLAWHENLDPYLKTWYAFVKSTNGLPYPGQWITKTLKNEMGTRKVEVADTVITSRTCRRTFETQMRLAGTTDIVIRAVLGHTDHSISDTYTDWSMFVPEIRKALVDKHFMITSGVI